MSNEKLEAGLTSHLTQELGMISDEKQKVWRCKDCGNTQEFDHRGCIKNENQRFYIDERVGCIAVRDRTKDNEWYSGLHSDLDGVKGYWTGVASNDEKGNFKQWSVLDWQRNKAKKLCDSLNTNA